MSPEEPCSSSAFKPVAISPNGRFSADIPHVSMVGKDKVIIGVIIGVIDRAINEMIKRQLTYCYRVIFFMGSMLRAQFHYLTLHFTIMLQTDGNKQPIELWLLSC